MPEVANYTIVRLLATAIRAPQVRSEILSALDFTHITSPVAQKVYFLLSTGSEINEEELIEERTWGLALENPYSEEEVKRILVEIKREEQLDEEIRKLKELVLTWKNLTPEFKRKQLFELIQSLASGKLIEVTPEDLVNVPEQIFYSRYLPDIQLYPQRYTIIGGRPGMGKTTLSIQIALEAIKEGFNLAVATLELSPVVWAKKASWLYRCMNHLPPAIRLEDLTEDEIEILEKTRFIDSVFVENILDGIKLVNPPKLVIIDYIQLMLTREKMETRNQELSYISSLLRESLKQDESALIVCSQLRRSFGQASLADLRDSGSLEADADTVVLIEEIPEDIAEDFQETPVKYRSVRVAKNRYGELSEKITKFEGYFPD